MKKNIEISFGTLFAILAILIVAVQSFVVGTTRYTPAEKPIPFWAGVGLLAVLAVFFLHRGLNGRKKIATRRLSH
jgi:hypothetical protein